MINVYNKSKLFLFIYLFFVRFEKMKYECDINRCFFQIFESWGTNYFRFDYFAMLKNWKNYPRLTYKFPNIFNPNNIPCPCTFLKIIN